MDNKIEALKGRFRVVEIDICVATGFDDDDPLGENCCIVIGDYRPLWYAKFLARRTRGGRFARQVHDETGKCIYYSGERGYGFVPEIKKEEI